MLCTVSFRRRAPCEPPETSRVGSRWSRPKYWRASGRDALRSRVAMVRRNGMPMYRESRSLLSGVETATKSLYRAPILLARPGRAFASCTTIGTPARLAAR